MLRNITGYRFQKIRLPESVPRHNRYAWSVGGVLLILLDLQYVRFLSSHYLRRLKRQMSKAFVAVSTEFLSTI